MSDKRSRKRQSSIQDISGVYRRNAKTWRRTIIRSLVAFMISTLFFIGTFLFIRHFNLFVTSQEKIEQIRQRETANLQEYIISQKISVKDVILIKNWKPLSQGITPYIIGDDEDISFIIKQDEKYPDLGDSGKSLKDLKESSKLQFADGELWIYIEVDRKTKDRYIALDISLVLAILLYIILYLWMFSGDTKYLLYLMHELDFMSQGEFDREIEIRSDDELGLIGGHINEMRKSIAEQIMNERQITQNNEELATVISHDLRTPLTRQIGYLEILHLKKYHDDAQRDDYIEKARNNALIMKDMTEKIFRYFLIFSRGEKERKRKADGKEYINSVLKEQGEYLISKGFDVRTDRIGEPFEMMIDEEALPRVFDNLFLNIEKYADKGKPVTVECRLDTEEKKLTLIFTNTISLPEAKVESTGVGLMSVKRVMRYHGGQFRVEDDKETYRTYLTFDVTLPGQEM